MRSRGGETPKDVSNYVDKENGDSGEKLFLDVGYDSHKKEDKSENAGNRADKQALGLSSHDGVGTEKGNTPNRYKSAGEQREIVVANADNRTDASPKKDQIAKLPGENLASPRTISNEDEGGKLRSEGNFSRDRSTNDGGVNDSPYMAPPTVARVARDPVESNAVVRSGDFDVKLKRQSDTPILLETEPKLPVNREGNHDIPGSAETMSGNKHENTGHVLERTDGIHTNKDSEVKQTNNGPAFNRQSEGPSTTGKHVDSLSQEASSHIESGDKSADLKGHKIVDGELGQSRKTDDNNIVFAALSVPIPSDAGAKPIPIPTNPLVVSNQGFQPLLGKDLGPPGKGTILSAPVDAHQQEAEYRSAKEKLDPPSKSSINGTSNLSSGDDVLRAGREGNDATHGSRNHVIDRMGSQGRIEASEKEGDLPNNADQKTLSDREGQIAGKSFDGKKVSISPNKTQDTDVVPTIMPPGLPGLEITIKNGKGKGIVANRTDIGTKETQTNSTENKGIKTIVDEKGKPLNGRLPAEKSGQGAKNGQNDKHVGQLSGKNPGSGKGIKNNQEIPIILPPGLPGLAVKAKGDDRPSKGTADQGGTARVGKTQTASARFDEPSNKASQGKIRDEIEGKHEIRGQFPSILPPGIPSVSLGEKDTTKSTGGAKKGLESPIDHEDVAASQDKKTVKSNKVILDNFDDRSGTKTKASTKVTSDSWKPVMVNGANPGLIPEMELVENMRHLDKKKETPLARRELASDESSTELQAIDLRDKSGEKGAFLDAEYRLAQFVKLNRVMLENAIKQGATSLFTEFSSLIDQMEERTGNGSDHKLRVADKDDTAGGGFQREEYIVSEGDTLASIALDRYSDRLIAELIWRMNKQKLEGAVQNGDLTIQLRVGTRLFMPTSSEAESFRSQFGACFGQSKANSIGIEITE